MKISIITPTFNAVAFIDQCVENVRTQGDVVLEHIIVDGGSTDGTVEAIERLAAVHRHIRILYGPDRGQSDAMNKGSDCARAEIIGILNVDDYYEPGACADAAALLAACHKPTVVVGDCRVIDEHDNLKWWSRPTDLRLERLIQPSSRYALPANPSAYFYHREVHQLVGGYDVGNRFSMDIDFLFKAFRKVKGRYVPRHWGNFRLIPGCKSFQNQVEDRDPVSALRIREKRHLPWFKSLIFHKVKYFDMTRDKARRLAHKLGYKRQWQTGH